MFPVNFGKENNVCRWRPQSAASWWMTTSTSPQPHNQENINNKQPSNSPILQKFYSQKHTQLLQQQQSSCSNDTCQLESIKQQINKLESLLLQHINNNNNNNNSNIINNNNTNGMKTNTMIHVPISSTPSNSTIISNSNYKSNSNSNSNSNANSNINSGSSNKVIVGTLSIPLPAIPLTYKRPVSTPIPIPLAIPNHKSHISNKSVLPMILYRDVACQTDSNDEPTRNEIGTQTETRTMNEPIIASTFIEINQDTIYFSNNNN